MKQTVLVLIPAEEKHRLMLENAAPEVQFCYSNASSVTNEQMEQADIIIGNLPVSMLSQARKLKWLQLNSAGYDDYTKAGVLSKDTLLTNATGAYGLAISEHMLAVLLMCYKKLDRYWENQKQSLWKDEGSVRSIDGAVVLSVGLGNIGGDFARKMKALGAYTIGIKRHLGEKPQWLDELYSMDQLGSMISRADIVALSLPASAETYHLFSHSAFDQMKQGAVLLNVGRGSVIDEEALCDALDSGKLSGACLDVAETEPLPSSHRLWHTKNVYITPHISGGYHLPQTLDRIVEIAADNLGRFLRNEPLRNQISF
jgi:phosphoglycerate dehydrogenase-like enzyme